jgi:hypothetical protein
VTNLQDFSRRLFAAANQLWTNTALRPDQYAHPVLALIALRQMEAKFEEKHPRGIMPDGPCVALTRPARGRAAQARGSIHRR